MREDARRTNYPAPPYALLHHAEGGDPIRTDLLLGALRWMEDW